MTLRDKFRKFKQNIKLAFRTSRVVEFAATVNELVDTIDTLALNREQAQALAEQLENLGRAIADLPIPPHEANAVRHLLSSIEKEARWVMENLKRGRGIGQQVIGSSGDKEELDKCSRRVQNYLQQFTVSMDITTSHMIGELTTENRLNRLSPSLSACYNSAQAVKLKRRACTKGTRTMTISHVLNWVNDSASDSVFWMSGMAGTGKTTIAYSLCERLDSQRQLAASFFCSRLIPECHDASLILPSIAYQLACFSNPFRTKLSEVIRNNPSAHTCLPHIQFESLIAQPLLETKDIWPPNVVVVIDALDECGDKESISRIVEVLITQSSPLPVKFFLSSRPEPQIRAIIEECRQPLPLLHLHDVEVSLVRGDIMLYLRDQLVAIGPTEDEVAVLAERAGVSFIYAAVMVRYITYGNSSRGSSRARLKSTIDSPNELKDAPYREIDKLYTEILEEALGDPSLDDTDRNNIHQVLRTVVCAPEPMTIATLSLLTNLDTDDVQDALQPLWSVLHVSNGDGTALVTTFHASFPAFMLDPSRSKHFYYGPKSTISAMTQHCFGIFRDTQPQFNICGLKSSYVPDSKIPDLQERVANVVSRELLYAAQHWARHLHQSSESAELLQLLEEFLSSRLLLWMEIMNLRNCTHMMPEAMRLVKEWAESGTQCSADLKALVLDALRFTTAFTLSEVSMSTPHIYTSMVPFWPKSSPISQCYAGRIQGMIQFDGGAISQRQGALLAIRHFDDVTMSPTFSPDGTQVAVGVGNRVLLLDASTGQETQYLKQGHSDTAVLIKFLADGRGVTSISADGRVYTWDTQTGATAFKPRQLDLGAFRSIALSPDCNHIAVGSRDDTVSIWNCPSEKLLHGPLTWHHGPIIQVKYLPDGTRVAGCGMSGIALWGTQNGKLLHRFLPGEDNDHFCSIDITPDCSRIASGSTKNTIYVWDINSGQTVLGPLKPSNIDHDPFISVFFSLDGLHLFSGSEDGSIYAWDIQTGTPACSPLEGHTDNITSINSSPNNSFIISGSHDRSLRFWDTRNIPRKSNLLDGHSGPVTSVGFSPNGMRIVSGSADQTVCVWGLENGALVFDPFRKSRGDKVLTAYSPVGDLIISNSLDGLVLLDAQTGNVVLGPILLDQSIQSAVFSPDGTCIILALTSNTIRVLAAATGKTLLDISAPLTSKSTWAHITSIAASPDGGRIAIGSMHSSLSTFDVSSGKLIYDPIDGHTHGSRALAFSPDGTRIVSSSFSTVSVRDVQTGDIVLEPQEGHTDRVDSAEFSPDGSQIVSGAKDNTICVWDAQTGKSIFGPLYWHTGPVRSVRFSPDGSRVVSGSNDKTIRVTDISRQFLPSSGSLSPTGSDWRLSNDGWIIDAEGRLLAWVPPDLRTALMWPRTELLISRQGWFRPNFSASLLGDSWASCYKSD